MKKLVIFLIIILFSNTNTYAETVIGGVEYNQKIAREKVFKTPDDILNFDLIESKSNDNNNKSNLYALKQGITKFYDREISEFSDGTYGIMFFDEPEYYWFYSNSGKLISFTKKSSLDYPTKITRYSTDGTFINKGLKISKTESYIFEPNGKLIAHWVGNICFDINDNVIMTRKDIR